MQDAGLVRSIPAYAGEALMVWWEQKLIPVDPRVCGGGAHAKSSLR